MRRALCIVLYLLASLAVSAQNMQTNIDSILHAYIAVHKFNGSALVLENGQKVYEKSFGYQQADTKTLISKQSVFPIGSLTKPFTALVILKLVEENKLSVDDPINKYLPGYPRGNDIHIKHLLTHTAGLFEAFRKPEYLEQLNTDHTFLPEEKMAFFKNEALDFEPGSEFAYSNAGYDLLGIIIEKVTGLPYAAALDKYIFKPLKMQHSGFDFHALKDKNKVIGYAYISPTRQTVVKFWNASLTYASGALYSTTADLARFYKGIRDNKIISKEMFKQATTPFLDGYGYGWFIDTLHGDRVIDHGGNVAGATSYFLMMPEKNVCIILLNNITSTSLEKIGNTIYAALYNKPYKLPAPKKEVQLSAEKLQQYTGTYEVAANYSVEISQEGNQLFIAINNGSKIKLSAENEHRFFINDDDMILDFIFTGIKVSELKISQGLSTKVADKK